MGETEMSTTASTDLLSEKSAVVVLGMHRSGTSSVAGVMSLLGAASPKTLMPAAEDNPRGFWESQVLMEFHDELLRAGDSNWRDWRPFPLPAVLAANPGLVDQARIRLGDEFGDQHMIVLKDPRICRFFPLWQKVLEDAGYRIVVISPLRHPLEVAASLMARNAMGFEEACRLWLRHVLDAERATRAVADRLFIDWSSFLGDWRTDMRRLQIRTGLPLDFESEETSRKIDAFLSTELRRQRPIDAELPSLVATAWRILAGEAGRENLAALDDGLDELRWSFDQASLLFADAPR
ncbi:sulfotransferase family protein [Pseudomonas sp. ODNR1LW]|nr:sulfotransferase family protein [Pseudomonas sp. ODNR1LW]